MKHRLRYQRKEGSLRTRKLLCLLLLAGLPASAFAASTVPVSGERALRDECSAYSEAGMRDCLARKADDSQKLLRQADRKVADIISTWDVDSQYVNQTRERLAASSREFSGYRDAQCHFMASLSASGIGNAHELRRLACIAELNDKRAEQLRDAVSDLRVK